MNNYVIPTHGKVMACLDGSIYGDSVTDHAVWAAARMSAPLTFMHVLDRAAGVAPLANLSGNIGIDAQPKLLEELARLDEQRSRVAAAHGRQLLDRARERATAAGIAAAEGLQRHGGLVEALTELETDVRLIVLGKRGQSADFSKGHLGANLERVARGVHRPVLVASRAFRPIKRFAIAFDGSATSRKAVGMVAESPLLTGLACDLVMAGQGSATERERLEKSAILLRDRGFEVSVKVNPGDAEAVLAEHVRDNAIDLLVMGAYGHSRVRQLILGSTTTQLIRTCLVPVLLLR
jgi:nucleotide-binding universal stress UspA family protein